MTQLETQFETPVHQDDGDTLHWKQHSRSDEVVVFLHTRLDVESEKKDDTLVRQTFSTERSSPGLSNPGLTVTTDFELNPPILHTMPSPASIKGEIMNFWRAEKPPNQQRRVSDDGESKTSSTNSTSTGSDANHNAFNDQLEKTSRQIRLELRQAEMLELAAEAERAAEAGQERFMGRPSTFGDDSDLELDCPDPVEVPAPLPAPVSTSTLGFVTPTGKRNRVKIGVLALRDVTEVVPPFGEFHIHMRTHLARKKVPRNMLVFQEKDDERPLRQPKQNEMLGLLANFNFGTWGGRSHEDDETRASDTEASTSSSSARVGDFLAEHIQPSSRRHRRPPLDIPPGLELPTSTHFTPQAEKHPTSDYSAFTNVPESGRRLVFTNSDQNQSKVDFDLEGSATKHSPPRLQLPKMVSDPMLNLNDRPEQSLFQRNTSDTFKRGVTISEKNSVLLTPSPQAKHDMRASKESNHAGFVEDFSKRLLTPRTELREAIGSDFVTPVRLRDIRDQSLMKTLMNEGAPHPCLLRKGSSPAVLNQRSANFHQWESPDDSMKASISDAGATRFVLHPPHELNVSKSFEEIETFRTSIALLPTMQGHAEPLVDATSSQDQVPATTSMENANGYCEDTCSPGNNGWSYSPLKRCPSLPVLHVPSLEIFPQDMSLDELSKGLHISGSRHYNFLEGEDHVEVAEGAKSIAMITKRSQDDVSSHVVVQGLPRENPREFSFLDSTGDSPHDGDSNQEQSKVTADFRCECLISPASSIDSNEAMVDAEGPGGSSLEKLSSWNLIHHGNNKSCSKQPLKAAVSMFSQLSARRGPSSSRVVFAKPRDNDDFLGNYLYCSKGSEKLPLHSQAICTEPCQETNLPCSDIAVDVCVGNIIESAMNMLPKKTNEGKKILSLSREPCGEMESSTWFDVANERFDTLLESIVGNGNVHGARWSASFRAPSLREKKMWASSQDFSGQLQSESYSEELQRTFLDDESMGSQEAGVPQRQIPAVPSLTDEQINLMYGVSRQPVSLRSVPDLEACNAVHHPDRHVPYAISAVVDKPPSGFSLPALDRHNSY